MKVSVVVCTYSGEMYEHLTEALESVRSQTYDDVETVVVVDGNDALCERLEADYGDDPALTLHCNDENRGLSASRNNGLEYASGDVVAFMDDDAVADENWIERLVARYEDRDVPAVGGKMTPLWVAGEPTFLPAEFYWLVGVTPAGFADGEGEVRNTFGSNISFRREVFDWIGGFDPAFGVSGGRNLQAEETEFAVRLRRETGHGVWYAPDAVVAHKVFDYRTDPRWLLERAFWQGYSKRLLERELPDSSGTERDFLSRLLFESVPERAGRMLRRRSRTEAVQLAWLFVLTAAVGVGYLWGALGRAMDR